MSEDHLPKFWYSLAELEEITKLYDYTIGGSVRFKTLRVPVEKDKIHFIKNVLKNSWEPILEEAFSNFICVYTVEVLMLHKLSIHYKFS